MEDKTMKRYERIIDEICKEVQKEMESCIIENYDRLHVEKEYGTAWVDVEIYVVPSWLKLTDVQVRVLHEDDRHQSPTLEQEIIACLPDWFDIEERMQQVA
jgi:hypothetical protein